jgi:hypothetical protein
MRWKAKRALLLLSVGILLGVGLASAVLISTRAIAGSYTSTAKKFLSNVQSAHYAEAYNLICPGFGPTTDFMRTLRLARERGRGLADFQVAPTFMKESLSSVAANVTYASGESESFTLVLSPKGKHYCVSDGYDALLQS